MKAPFALAFILLLVSCRADVKYLGNSGSGFTKSSGYGLTPAEAYKKAEPHLAETFRLRCEKIHMGRKHWCEKKPADHLVISDGTYYFTRTAYPYKTFYAYLRYAVKVDAETGETVPATE